MIGVLTKLTGVGVVSGGPQHIAVSDTDTDAFQHRRHFAEWNLSVRIAVVQREQLTEFCK